MPCIKCMSQELREIILSDLPESYVEMLNGIDTCENDAFIEFEKNGKKGKRKPSEYNKFIGTCMKNGKGMKHCAGDWSKNKK